jgi:hypothetical protein
MTNLTQAELIDRFFLTQSARKYGECDRFSDDVWLFVDKANNVFISHDKPTRLDENQWNLKALNDVVMLPYSLCVVLTNRSLTWQDEPINISHIRTSDPSQPDGNGASHA